MRSLFRFSLAMLLASLLDARARAALPACGPVLVQPTLCEGWLQRQNIDLQNELRGGETEEELVHEALGSLTRQARWSGWEKACLWTSLAAHIERAVGHPVSRSFLWQRGQRLRYVFQGEKIVQGKRYILLLSPSGKAWTGLAEPIVDINQWEPPANLRRLVLQ